MSKTVIEMAREAGVYSGANERVFASSLERFAALVAAQEREACALVCDQAAKQYNRMARGGDTSGASDHMEIAAENLAEDIRARKEET